MFGRTMNIYLKVLLKSMRYGIFKYFFKKLLSNFLKCESIFLYRLPS